MAWRTRRKILISTQTRSRTSSMGSSYHMLCSSTRSRSTWSSNIRRSGGGPTTGTASCGTCSSRSGRRACSRGSCLAGRSSRISRINYIQVYILAPGVDAEHPEKYEHVERDGQRDQREDHPAVGANSEESRVVDAVVDLQLFGSTRENLVGRLGARRERRELGGVGLGREAPLRDRARGGP